MKRTIYFDLETAGLLETHPIIQIAAVAIDDATWEELAAIEIKLQFDVAAADPEALKINHYDAEVWKAQAIAPWRAAERFSRFLEPHKCIPMVSKRTGRPYSVAQLAGHNVVSFDGPRLMKLYKDLGIFLPADPRVLDTMQAAMWWFHARGTRPESFKLEALCKHFGIPIAEGETHDALADVRLTSRLAQALEAPRQEKLAA